MVSSADIPLQITLAGSDISYSVFIGTGSLHRLPMVLHLGRFSKALAILDDSLSLELAEEVQQLLPTGSLTMRFSVNEAKKNIDSVLLLWEKFQSFRLDRRSVVINVGGGTLGDVAGFAASTFMRGISFIQVPTTLLAQVDASIGGKVGVNFGGVKNLVGSIQQPTAVLVDPKLLLTLPDREYKAGWAEIIKHGAISDKEYLRTVFSPLSEAALQAGGLDSIIRRSCEIKASIVRADEREEGLRKTLNFGHTIGHAIESLSHEKGLPLLHGEAVSIGMIGEAKISELVGKLPKDDFLYLERAIANHKLPVRSPFLCVSDEIVEKMRNDKKNDSGKIRWTLLEGLGHGIFDQLVPDEIVGKALLYLSGNNS
jgi:3-dehydroquinate synthase